MKQLLVEYFAAEMQLSMFMLQAHPGLEASSLSFSFWTVSLLSNLDVTTVILAEHLEKARQLWFSDLLNWGFWFLSGKLYSIEDVKHKILLNCCGTT